MASSHERESVTPEEVSNPLSSEDIKDRFVVEVSRPDKLFLLATQQAYGDTPQKLISLTEIYDDLLAGEESYLGFANNEVQTGESGLSKFYIESKLRLSEQRQSRADCGYFNTDRINELQQVLEERDIAVTAGTYLPNSQKKEFVHNLLFIEHEGFAVRIDFGFNSGEMEREYILAKAQEERQKGIRGSGIEQLDKVRKGLSNDRVAFTLVENNSPENMLSRTYLELKDANDFKQKMNGYAQSYEEVVKALYVTEDLIPPNKIVTFHPSISEKVKEEAAVEQSVWLMDENVKEKFPSFKDIGGQLDIIQELKEVVRVINNPDIFTKRGVQREKGILLSGEPGNGKTLFLQAIAKETNAEFFLVSCADIISKWRGVPEQNMRQVFMDAARYTDQGENVIIGFEEIDALFLSRDNFYQSSSNVVATFLEYMDGPRSNTKISVIGTTNRADDIDPAVLRPGRFDRKIEVKKPDMEGRKSIFKIHMDKSQKISNQPEELFDTAFDLDYLAEVTNGLSGAEIANLVNLTLKQKTIAEIEGNSWTPISVEDFKTMRRKMERKKDDERIGFRTTATSNEFLYNR